MTPDEQQEARLTAFIASIKGMDVATKMKLYIQSRNAKNAAKKAFEKQTAGIDRIMDACETLMLAEAHDQGVTGFSTPYGTSYVATTKKISISNEEAFMDFLKTQENPFDFYTKAVSSTHIDKYMELSGGVPPPGLNIFREKVLRIRKASDK